MHTSEVLNRAADLIEERGWTTGISGWARADSPLCLEGGIMAALGMNFESERLELWECPAYQAVADYLGRDVSTTDRTPPREALWKWNDGHGSAVRVIAVLRATALIEAAREEQDAAWETYAEVVTA